MVVISILIRCEKLSHDVKCLNNQKLKYKTFINDCENRQTRVYSLMKR